MNNLPYSKEELEILDFIENEKPESVPNVNEKIEQLKLAVRNKMQVNP